MSDELLARFGPTRYLPSVWFQYQPVGQRLAWCQTDGLVVDYRARRILIVEVKYKHTPDAYFQLEQKYVPVIRRILPDWTICTVEIVKWYDPHTAFPVKVSLKSDILDTRPNEFGVHILNV